MSERVVRGRSMVDADELEKTQNQVMYLRLALQDALAELVHERGPDYLDVFLERRIRRTAEVDRLSNVMLPTDVEGLAEHREAVAQAGINVLTSTVESVRRDPHRVA